VTAEVVVCQPMGCLTDTKGNKIAGFDSIDKKQVNKEKLLSHQQLLVVTTITGSILKPWIDPRPAYFAMMAVFWVFIPYLIGLLRLFQRNALPPFSD
jgi:hypothetical protein